MNQRYTLYILLCADGSLYTGITVDVARRLQEHNSSTLGAKYTRGRRPVKLVYTKGFRNRSAAAKAEARMKQLSRAEKILFVSKKASIRKNNRKVRYTR